MVAVDVVRVFVAPDGGAGNPLGVVLDGRAVGPNNRRTIAARLGFSETVFVEDQSRGLIRIFTPARELPFAGHPLVGTAWMLGQHRRAGATLRPPAGDVPTWTSGDSAWIWAKPEWVHSMALRQLSRVHDVDALAGPPTGDFRGWYGWAWIDESRGLVRARYFVPELGREDEATGAAAILLCHRLDAPLTIQQGGGSVLHVRPRPEGWIELGGRVRYIERRALADVNPSSPAR